LPENVRLCSFSRIACRVTGATSQRDKAASRGRHRAPILFISA
jgi:hypothetical protein